MRSVALVPVRLEVNDMRLDVGTARERLADERVARLATVSADARPHIVPIVFAVEGDTLYSTVDAKPKTTTALRRLENIEANPQVSVLVDHYDEDWDRLWWVRADGFARLADEAAARHGLQLLADRYPQYRTDVPLGPTIVVQVTRWSGWSAS